jgi:hypothetical protein
MSDMHRREFIAVAATAAMAGMTASTAVAADTPTTLPADAMEVIKHDHGTGQDAGVDIVVRLTGSIVDDAAVLTKLSTWLTDNKEKFGMIAILESGTHELILRLAPTGKEMDAEGCHPCHMPGCSCSCFAPGGVGHNCKDCAHSRPDHH